MIPPPHIAEARAALARIATDLGTVSAALSLAGRDLSAVTVNQAARLATRAAEQLDADDEEIDPANCDQARAAA